MWGLPSFIAARSQCEMVHRMGDDRVQLQHAERSVPIMEVAGGRGTSQYASLSTLRGYTMHARHGYFR